MKYKKSKIFRKIFYLTLILFLYNGCTATTNSYSSADILDSGKAIVKGVEYSTLSYLLPSLTSKIEVAFIEVDGEKVGGFWKGRPHEIILSPGQHELFVHYSNLGPPADFAGDTTISIYAERGKIYQLKPILLPGFRCEINIEEIEPE